MMELLIGGLWVFGLLAATSAVIDECQKNRDRRTLIEWSMLTGGFYLISIGVLLGTIDFHRTSYDQDPTFLFWVGVVVGLVGLGLFSGPILAFIFDFRLNKKRVIALCCAFVVTVVGLSLDLTNPFPSALSIAGITARYSGLVACAWMVLFSGWFVWKKFTTT